MKKFKTINDVEDWLEPMDYSGFWYAIEPFELNLQDRSDIDQQIKNGIVSVETVLTVMKGFARIELTKRLRLKHRELTPWVKPVESH